MNDRALDDHAIAAMTEVLERSPAVVAGYLLGSASEGRLRPDSDVDIAILPKFREGIPIQERLRLVADLSQAAGRIVDLGILSTASLVYAKEAVANGRLLVDREPLATARFAMYALSMYASLQEARREVLEAYAA